MRKMLDLFVLAALLLGLASAPASGSVVAQSPAIVLPPGPRLSPGGVVQGSVKPAQVGLVVQAVDLTGRVAASAVTNARGAYALERLTPGLYRLEVLTSENASLPLKDSWMVQVPNVDAVVQARPLELAVKVDAASERVAAPATASIQGTVTGAGHGALQYSYVYAYRSGDYDWSYYAYTNASGVYTLTVAAGSYKLKFDRNNQFAPEWYNNQPDMGSATVLTVADGGSLTGIDAELAVGGTISGDVTDESLNPLSGVSITAWDANGDYVSSAYTLFDGTYQLMGLPTGNFRVQFDPRYSPTPDYVAEFYNDQPDLDSADPVAVTLGNDTPNIDAELAPGGAITGTLTAMDGGAPLEGYVYLFDSRTVGEYDYINADYVPSSGEYELHGLAAGVYYLRAEPYYTSPYLKEYYENQAALADADPVTVTVGVTTQIDFALQRGATITGQVVGPATATLGSRAALSDTLPINGLRVRLYDGEYGSINSTTTNAQGYYTFTALTSGSYYLGFVGDEEHNYITEYYNGKPTLAEADPIPVTPPQVIQANAELAEGGMFSGQVTAADSSLPLANVTALIYGLDECNNYSFIRSILTNASGYYTVTGLITGTYYVEFKTFYASGLARDYLGQPYRAPSGRSAWPTSSDAASSDLGDPIQVIPGSPVSNIDAALPRGGQITGVVTAADSSLPLGDVYVTAYTAVNGYYNYLGYLSTNASGVYTTPALATGSYVLYFNPYEGDAAPYVPEYYNDQWNINQAITIPVTLGNLTSDIDVSLARGAQVSGKVIASDTSDPLEDVEIGLSPMFGDGVYRNAVTDQNGDFVTPGIPPGPYTLGFYTSNWNENIRDYVDEYYNDQMPGNGTVFTLTTPTVHTGFDASLARGGSISGVVTAESDGTPLNNAYAYAYNANQWTIGYDWTDADGFYIMYGLPAGPTKIQFYGPRITQQCRTIEYASEYYNDKSTFDTADPVTVTPPNTTPNIDASLAIERIVGLIKLFLPIITR